MPRNAKLKRQVDEMVGRNIERLRLLHGVDPKMLARGLNVSPGMIRLYERGQRGLNVAQLVWFSTTFKVSVEEMIYGEAAGPKIVPFHRLRV